MGDILSGPHGGPEGQCWCPRSAREARCLARGRSPSAARWGPPRVQLPAGPVSSELRLQPLALPWAQQLCRCPFVFLSGLPPRSPNLGCQGRPSVVFRLPVMSRTLLTPTAPEGGQNPHGHGLGVSPKAAAAPDASRPPEQLLAEAARMGALVAGRPGRRPAPMSHA